MSTEPRVSPAFARPDAPADERAAILQMLREMHPDTGSEALDGLHPLDVLEFIIVRIERGDHRRPG